MVQIIALCIFFVSILFQVQYEKILQSFKFRPHPNPLHVEREFQPARLIILTLN